MLRTFTIDEQYITDVTVRIEHDLIKDRSNPSNEDLIRMLKGHDRTVTISNKDHDQFARLREELGKLGYISIERGWWNGDRVLRSFKLNEWTFRKGHKFPSAAAVKVMINLARLQGRSTISHL